MKERNMKKKFLFLLLISVTINVICFLPYVGTYVDRIQQRFWPTSYYNVQSKDNEVIDAVINASLSMDGSAFSCEQPKRGLIYDVHNFIYPVHSTNLFNNYSHSYLYAGLSEYAFKKKNKRILNHLVQETKTFTAGNSLTYRLQEVDQIPIGICFLNLYQITGEECYLNIAKSIYKWLLGRRESNSNIIYYRKGDNQFVDALGMYVPFLVKYSKVTGILLHIPLQGIMFSNFMLMA